MLAERHNSTIRIKKYLNELWWKSIAVQENDEGYWAKIQWQKFKGTEEKGAFKVLSLQTVSIKKIIVV